MAMVPLPVRAAVLAIADICSESLPTVRKNRFWSGKPSRAIAVAVGEHSTIPAVVAWPSTRRATFDEAGPMIASTPAEMRAFRSTEEVSSAVTSSTGWPRTPPWALIVSTADCTAAVSGLPRPAPAPVVGNRVPSRSTPSSTRLGMVVVTAGSTETTGAVSFVVEHAAVRVAVRIAMTEARRSRPPLTRSR